jgi:hypothetical protein
VKLLLSFRDEISGNGNRCYVYANITTDGEKKIRLDDGTDLDLVSWICLGYKLVRATEPEQELICEMLIDRFGADRVLRRDAAVGVEK